MINAIDLLRTTADKCERRAKDATDRAVKVELFDMTVEWHLLARKAAYLHERTKQLEASS